MTPDLDATLRALVATARGFQGAALVDADGIALAAAAAGGPDIEEVGARSAILLRQVEEVLERLGGGEAGTVVVEMERATIAHLPVKARVALLLVLAPGGDLGRALFEGRKAAFRLAQEL